MKKGDKYFICFFILFSLFSLIYLNKNILKDSELTSIKVNYNGKIKEFKDLGIYEIKEKGIYFKFQINKMDHFKILKTNCPKKICKHTKISSYQKNIICIPNKTVFTALFKSKIDKIDGVTQ